MPGELQESRYGRLGPMGVGKCQEQNNSHLNLTMCEVLEYSINSNSTTMTTSNIKAVSLVFLGMIAISLIMILVALSF